MIEYGNQKIKTIVKGSESPKGEDGFDQFLSTGHEFFNNDWTVTDVIKDSSEYVKVFIDNKFTELYGDEVNRATLEKL